MRSALTINLIAAKDRLKRKSFLTDKQADQLSRINAELERREHETAKSHADAQLSAAWDKFLFD